MAKEFCEATVTGLDRNPASESCEVSTRYFNNTNWLVFGRKFDHDYIIEIAAIRELFQDSNNVRRLRIGTQYTQLWVEFADGRQAVAWLKRIRDLKNGKSPEITTNTPKAISKDQRSSDKMEIPEGLRADVKLAVFETGVLGPIGAFSTTADIASIAGWWGYLLVQYSRHYGVQLDGETAKKICSTALLGMGGYYLGCKTATKLFHLIPGAGTLAAMGMSSLQNIIFTYRFAVTLTRIFSKGSVDFDTLADTVKYMFAGTAIGFLTIKNIWDLYVHY